MYRKFNSHITCNQIICWNVNILTVTCWWGPIRILTSYTAFVSLVSAFFCLLKSQQTFVPHLMHVFEHEQDSKINVWYRLLHDQVISLCRAYNKCKHSLRHSTSLHWDTGEGSSVCSNIPTRQCSSTMGHYGVRISAQNISWEVDWPWWSKHLAS
jgi:hypothetical protein